MDVTIWLTCGMLALGNVAEVNVINSSGYVLGWGTLAFIHAALANLDGRSPLKYFLVSLLLGPIVTIILAATYEDERGSLRQIDLLKGRSRK